MSQILEKKIREREEQKYDYPKKLDIRTYRDQKRQSDVTQVSFSWAPEMMQSEKFAFEIASDDLVSWGKSSRIDILEAQLDRLMESMEEAWKNEFSFLIHEGNVYSYELHDFEMWIGCPLCGEEESLVGPELLEREMLYLSLALNRIDCDC